MYCDWPELGRCCFCLPLRKGVIVLGYVNIIFYAFVIGLYSYSIHKNLASDIIMLSYGRSLNFPAEMCIAIYCSSFIFEVILVYGAHKQSVSYIKAYYYYALSTSLAVGVLQLVDLAVEKYHFGIILEMLTFTFAGFCLQVYLITLVRSLLKKMEKSGPHAYDNQLHQVVSGELRDQNGVYNNTTAPTVI